MKIHNPVDRIRSSEHPLRNSLMLVGAIGGALMAARCLRNKHEDELAVEPADVTAPESGEGGKVFQFPQGQEDSDISSPEPSSGQPPTDVDPGSAHP